MKFPHNKGSNRFPFLFPRVVIRAVERDKQKISHIQVAGVSPGRGQDESGQLRERACEDNYLIGFSISDEKE